MAVDQTDALKAHHGNNSRLMDVRAQENGGGPP
jgi:hypothetical protein